MKYSLCYRCTLVSFVCISLVSPWNPWQHFTWDRSWANAGWWITLRTGLVEPVCENISLVVLLAGSSGKQTLRQRSVGDVLRVISVERKMRVRSGVDRESLQPVMQVWHLWEVRRKEGGVGRKNLRPHCSPETALVNPVESSGSKTVHRGTLHWAEILCPTIPSCSTDAQMLPPEAVSSLHALQLISRFLEGHPSIIMDRHPSINAPRLQWGKSSHMLEMNKVVFE